MFSLTVAAIVFGVIFIAELPDKTALASLMLGTRFRAGKFESVINEAYFMAETSKRLSAVMGGAPVRTDIGDAHGPSQSRCATARRFCENIVLRSNSPVSTAM